eukprot:CAMPEP_0171074492 /NCGR_PEP_ID=MMETSP0766_2-20121228/12178_1 /TAXON_ID=439317 /ORGANISM="Gambierdiscus australes, Strain CAWD 149" /LENGTH=147 /DNA_ID=CAMNT_0011531283 /DNA_START=80 /DNA_END=520 /DNA_ORIENTATION=-
MRAIESLLKQGKQGRRTCTPSELYADGGASETIVCDDWSFRAKDTFLWYSADAVVFSAGGADGTSGGAAFASRGSSTSLVKLFTVFSVRTSPSVVSAGRFSGRISGWLPQALALSRTAAGACRGGCSGSETTLGSWLSHAAAGVFKA